jgi:hypothetical protein
VVARQGTQGSGAGGGERGGVGRVTALLRRYPLAVSGVFLFSLFMSLAYAPYDMFVKLFTQPISAAEEVWFGFMLRGWAAKATEPLHWLIYASLSYGFYRERRWAWPFASLYTLQVALGMVVWALLYARHVPGMPVISAAIGLLLVGVAAAVWRARPVASATARA